MHFQLTISPTSLSHLPHPFKLKNNLKPCLLSLYGLSTEQKKGYSVSLTFFCGTLTTEHKSRVSLSLFQVSTHGSISLITLLVLLHAFFLSICGVVGKDGQICSPSSCVGTYPMLEKIKGKKKNNNTKIN